jgi:hypothetical protein
MRYTRIQDHIDIRIADKLASGDSLFEIRQDMASRLKRCKERDVYHPELTKFELLSNWENIDLRVRYTTYYVMYTEKRIKDIEWMITNQYKFDMHKISDCKLFKLIRFKEKVR